MELNSKIPDGPLDQKWTKYKGNVRLVAPANKRSIDVIVVGTGLAGASAAASLAEMGYSVKALCFQDSPRRAHSIAAQGGINAAKNYMNDGDSTFRLFYDTIKGGDYRSREANVHRLAEVSANMDCWTTVLLVVHRFLVRSTRKDKPDSNCCWEPIQHSPVKSEREP